MRVFILALLALGAICHEMLVTKEYTDYLKRHVEWEVVDYEENAFRGWTMDEAKAILGLKESSEFGYLDTIEPKENLPTSINWANDTCIHEVRNQGNCGSCWAFATSGMLADRCCMHKKDEGLLSPQELVSCDETSEGCSGGWCTWAMEYVKSAKGLVPDACFPYKATDLPCPTKCVKGEDWKKSHVCDCKSYKVVDTVQKIKTALVTGPVTFGFGVCRSFFNYKSGNYKCDCGSSYVGLHAVEGVGFKEEGKDTIYHVKNSWGASWGMKGYFDILSNTCGISGNYPKGNVFCEKF
jgi:C1A family cysteine protease